MLGIKRRQFGISRGDPRGQHQSRFIGFMAHRLGVESRRTHCGPVPAPQVEIERQPQTSEAGIIPSARNGFGWQTDILADLGFAEAGKAVDPGQQRCPCLAGKAIGDTDPRSRRLKIGRLRQRRSDQPRQLRILIALPPAIRRPLRPVAGQRQAGGGRKGIGAADRHRTQMGDRSTSTRAKGNEEQHAAASFR